MISIPSFFRKRLPAIDFSILKTDMHSHLIPSIDDGSKSVEDSILIIQSLMNLGFSNFITTPHVMPDYYNNDNQTILEGSKKVLDALSMMDVSVDFYASAEYYIDFEFQKRISENSLLYFGDKYILVEFSFVNFPNNFFEILFDLQVKGYQVILAHPERYTYLTLKDYIDFVDKGLLLQINLLSLVGYYGPNVTRCAKILIDNELISFAGTDCHNLQQSQNLKKCFTNKYWHQLVNSDKLKNHTL